MAGFWTKLLSVLKGKKNTHRSRSVAQRFLKLELLEGRKLMANDLATITGTVFTDATENGVVDGSDARIVGATVTLFLDDGDNVFDSGDTQVGSPATTNSLGVYTFNNLGAGRYFVQQSAVAGQLQRTSETVKTVDITPTQALGSAVDLIDDFNSGTQVVTATVGGVTPVSDATNVTGVLGNERDVFADATGGTSGNTVSLRVDNAGTSNLLEFQSDAGTTGTRIVTWDGDDNDGATLEVTTGLGGIDLTDGGNASAFRLKIGTDIASNLVVRVFSTAANSSFGTFTMPVTAGGAATGDLVIRFAELTGTTGAGATFTSVRAIQLEFDGAAAADGQVDIFETAGVTTITTNFANLNPMSVGDLVWQDRDNDGVKDASETGIQNITVQVYQDDGDGGFDSGDTLVGTSTTNASGIWSVGNLLPGDYIALIPITELGTGNDLAGYQVSAGTVADPDNNVNDDNNGVLIAGVGVATGVLTIVAGSEPINDGDTSPNTNLTLDLALLQPST